MTVPRKEKAYEKYAWIVFLVMPLLSVVIVVLFHFTHPLLSVPDNYQAVRVLRAFETAEIGFSLFTVVILFKGFRKGERWAWYAFWFWPVHELSAFVAGGGFNPPPGQVTVQHLVFLLVFVLGLLLPYRKFFPKKPAGRATVS
ncbi:MAG: hypothetical protein LYZ66_05350 [Nitrososphaerales archaeon]|nr:hypothetical protein [Nitrososphaerales archaeon]